MVVKSQRAFDHFSPIKRQPGATSAASYVVPDIDIPVVDLSAAAGEGREEVSRKLVRACEDMGFFKVVNHGVGTKLMGLVEAEAKRFFNLPQIEKDKAGPPTPLGYGSKRIGPNGDIGWIEYLLFHTSMDINSLAAFRIAPDGDTFRTAVKEYVNAMKGLACEVLELMVEGLNIEQKISLSDRLKDDESDSLFRLNHYPPLPPELQLQPIAGTGRRNKLVGFGEHTDPQIISVLRSNDTSGLQVCLQDGTTWATVPPDQSSFFINVGDSLQVMTNGRFKSVRHRVITDPTRSRVSMIYFGAPPLNKKISPMKELMEEGEESLYEEFTWCEYKKSTYKSRLSDYRLGPFEKRR